MDVTLKNKPMSNKEGQTNWIFFSYFLHVLLPYWKQSILISVQIKCSTEWCLIFNLDNPHHVSIVHYGCMYMSVRLHLLLAPLPFITLICHHGCMLHYFTRCACFHISCLSYIDARQKNLTGSRCYFMGVFWFSTFLSAYSKESESCLPFRRRQVSTATAVTSMMIPKNIPTMKASLLGGTGISSAKRVKHSSYHLLI